MSGNVWECVITNEGPRACGGSYADIGEALQPSSCVVIPAKGIATVGFRVCFMGKIPQ